MKITTFPKFGGDGRTASLLDEELILLGNDAFGTKGKYITIQKPRNGLLGIKYSVDNFPLRQIPHGHTALLSKNTLAVVGGQFKSKGKLSKFTWTELSLFWKNGTKFSPNVIHSCNIKLGSDVHMIFGGALKGKDQQDEAQGMSTVLKLNTREEIVVELKPMNLSRVFHSCQLLTHDIVLVSGGLAHEGESGLQQDELYNITSQETVKLLDHESSLKRYQHATSRLGNQVYAFGGLDSDNIATNKIAVFDNKTNSWTDLNQELHSSNTTELVVTPFPVSSLDCGPECHCGVANKTERIFGGSEAEVRIDCSYLPFIFQRHIALYSACWSMVDVTNNFSSVYTDIAASVGLVKSPPSPLTVKSSPAVNSLPTVPSQSTQYFPPTIFHRMSSTNVSIQICPPRNNP